MTHAGRTAVITGAAGGLGRALCRRLGREGMRIVALDIDAAALERLAEELGRAGIAVETAACDLTDAAACREIAARVQQRHGAVDVLINNAGVTHFSTFDRAGTAVIRRVMEINFLGAVAVTEAFLPLIEARKGSIVAISSVAGFSPLYGRSGYSASKHALHGFFDSLRSELREKGVHVMLVCPSFIATQDAVRRGGGSTDGTARPGEASQTAGTPLSPDAVADAVHKGIVARKRLLVLGRLGRLAYWVSRFAPAWFERAMERRIRPEFEA